ncbi:hypothetical protein Maq22A_c23540 [Methylobacterium aquaticum]|uniref:Uncharacterized protein n=1 Tax=Methylobacterium aquaticum TaxID=270351 RepID=A0A0C6FKM7_9HYPH|nr:hypothetical protein Maq22A_c23540 [Methylobacterium aquaticum]
MPFSSHPVARNGNDFPGRHDPHPQELGKPTKRRRIPGTMGDPSRAEVFLVIRRPVRAPRCRVRERSDGRFDVLVTMPSGTVHRRAGYVSRADAESGIDKLADIMGVLGLSLNVEPTTPTPPAARPDRHTRLDLAEHTS